MVTHVRHETREDALRRLLVIAKDSGVRLLRDSHGDYWATSASDPGWLHKVEPGSCSCRGFARSGRCRHQATLLSHLGYLDDPEPDPAPMTITCAHVDGHYTLADEPEWMEPRTEIMVDGEPKVRITGDTFGLSVHWLEGGRPIDDLTGCTPSYMDHYECVRYWIEALDTRVPAHVAMQDAGIFSPGEFVDAEPVAA